MKIVHHFLRLFGSSISIRRLAILLLLSVGLSACNDIKTPIDADDFGFPKITVLAKGKNVQGERENELANWEFSGYQYNGSKAVVMVHNNTGSYASVWSSWGGNGEGMLTSGMQGQANCCVGTIDNSGECVSNYCAIPSNKYETIPNAPCVFSKGQGLYMLLTNPNNSSKITDPNQYPNVNRMPSIAQFFTVGLWEYTGMYQADTLANGYIYTNTTQPISSDYTNGDAYFKILDRYYDDNSGYFSISLKNGFVTSVTPPIASALNTIMGKLNAASESIFINITNNTDYHKSIKALLSIYIIIYGILYIGGIIQMSQKEMMNMMIKLIIVIQLLTTQTSWSVFNNYFFTFFTQGIGEIIGIMTANIAGETGGAGGLAFFDNILALLFSHETSMKNLALLISVPSGIIVVAIIYAAFAIFAFAIAKAVILYLLAYMMISLLISLAPIFITFLLFKSTRSLFDNWITQFGNYFIQPLLVFAVLALMGEIIINQMYKLLGFGVCYQNWLYVGSFVITKAWKICSFNSNSAIQAIIPVPGYVQNPAPGLNGNPADPNYFCSPYECLANRYVDLPFLDPVKDASLISAFNSPFVYLNLPMLYNSFMLLLLTYLVFKFNDTIPSLAKGISGGGLDLGNAASTAMTSLRKGAISGFNEMVNQATRQASKQLKGTKLGEAFENYQKYKKKRRDSAKALEADIPDEEKNKLLKGAGKAVGSLFNAAHFLARVAIPPGSLRSAHLEESSEDRARREGGRLGATKFGQALSNKIGNATGYNKVMAGAAAFDQKYAAFKEGIVDVIGSRFDKLGASFQRATGFDKLGKALGFKTRAGIDERSENIAILRKLGVLDKGEVYGNNASQLSARDKRQIENRLSAKDIEGLFAQADPKEVAKLRTAIGSIKQQDQADAAKRYADAVKAFKGAPRYVLRNGAELAVNAPGYTRQAISTIKFNAALAPIIVKQGYYAGVNKIIRVGEAINKVPDQTYQGLRAGIVAGYGGLRAGAVGVSDTASAVYHAPGKIASTVQRKAGEAYDTISKAPGQIYRDAAFKANVLQYQAQAGLYKAVGEINIKASTLKGGLIDITTSVFKDRRPEIKKFIQEYGKNITKMKKDVYNIPVKTMSMTYGAVKTGLVGGYNLGTGAITGSYNLTKTTIGAVGTGIGAVGVGIGLAGAGLVGISSDGLKKASKAIDSVVGKEARAKTANAIYNAPGQIGISREGLKEASKAIDSVVGKGARTKATKAIYNAPSKIGISREGLKEAGKAIDSVVGKDARIKAGSAIYNAPGQIGISRTGLKGVGDTIYNAPGQIGISREGLKEAGKAIDSVVGKGARTKATKAIYNAPSKIGISREGLKKAGKAIDSVVGKDARIKAGSAIYNAPGQIGVSREGLKEAGKTIDSVVGKDARIKAASAIYNAPGQIGLSREGIKYGINATQEGLYRAAGEIKIKATTLKGGLIDVTASAFKDRREDIKKFMKESSKSLANSAIGKDVKLAAKTLNEDAGKALSSMKKGVGMVINIPYIPLKNTVMTVGALSKAKMPDLGIKNGLSSVTKTLSEVSMPDLGIETGLKAASIGIQSTYNKGVEAVNDRFDPEKIAIRQKERKEKKVTDRLKKIKAEEKYYKEQDAKEQLRRQKQREKDLAKIKKKEEADEQWKQTKQNIQAIGDSILEKVEAIKDASTPGAIGEAIRGTESYKTVAKDYSNAKAKIAQDIGLASETLQKDIANPLERNLVEPVAKAYLKSQKTKKRNENEEGTEMVEFKKKKEDD